MKPITAEPNPAWGPALNEAFTGFALDARVSEELASKLNTMISAANLTGHSSISPLGYTSLYKAHMWCGGVPMDWYQVCRSLNDHGVNTSAFIAEVQAWQEANPL